METTKWRSISSKRTNKQTNKILPYTNKQTERQELLQRTGAIKSTLYTFQVFGLSFKMKAPRWHGLKLWTLLQTSNYANRRILQLWYLNKIRNSFAVWWCSLSKLSYERFVVWSQWWFFVSYSRGVIVWSSNLFCVVLLCKELTRRHLSQIQCNACNRSINIAQ